MSATNQKQPVAAYNKLPIRKFSMWIEHFWLPEQDRQSYNMEAANMFE